MNKNPRRTVIVKNNGLGRGVIITGEQEKKRNKKLRRESFTPYETLAVCAGRSEQSDRDHPCGDHKSECEENAHRDAQLPRDRTPGCEDGFVPALVPTAIQPSEILRERFGLKANTKPKAPRVRCQGVMPSKRKMAYCPPFDDPSHT